MRATVVVCSDSVAAGNNRDTSGELLAAGLTRLGCDVAPVVVVADDIDSITAAMCAAQGDVVVCCGGTGIGPRDVTPEAVTAVCDRLLPGFGEAFRARGRAQNPLADLSRAVAGVRGTTLVAAVPGSPGAIADAIAVLAPLLAHSRQVLLGGDHRALMRAAPLSAVEASASVQRDDAGAVVVFEGRVRDHDHDRPVSSLKYEAHPNADEVMQSVLDEAAGQPGVLAAIAYHRVGELGVGDLAFVAAVSAAHRAEAFKGCAWLVDRVKERLPVWKLQRFADGSCEWVNCA